VAVMAVGRMQAGGQGARSVYESTAAAAFRKESGNTTGAASLRGIGDGWANSATDVRVSAETAMQHTMVIARVTVISEPPRQADQLVGAMARQPLLGGGCQRRSKNRPAGCLLISRLFRVMQPS
jgi:hypothetical protein